MGWNPSGIPNAARRAGRPSKTPKNSAPSPSSTAVSRMAMVAKPQSMSQ
jgi:hypothetical protein